MIYPEPEKGGKGKKAVAPNTWENLGFDPMLLSRARAVLDFAPDLVPNMLAGSTSLDAAYETAKARKRDAASDHLT